MSAATSPVKQLHVISHTHWDREWYLSHESFRLRLVDLVDHVIEILESDPDFLNFHFDGQTIILDDYLEMRPRMLPRLQTLIKSGRILIGPWYLQNDEFLVDGESTIRNLLIGCRMCRQFQAEPMAVGYVPDQFGNISQLPQILKGFGITSAVFGRGCKVPGDKAEFHWESPDGSAVLAVYLFQWYNNAQRLPADPRRCIAMCQEIIAAQQGRAQTSHLLLMNGVDHLEAQENLSTCITAANAAARAANLPFQLRHSTLPQYLDHLQSGLDCPPLVHGELRDGDEGSVLSGTASSRVHLKQYNFQCQQLLRRWAEPFAALARLAGSDYLYEDPLDYAWKLLIQCHPHDSICGCSIDEVHFQMESRFRRILDVINDQLSRSLGYLAHSSPNPGFEFHSSITLFNPHPFPWSGVMETDIELLDGEGTLDQFVLRSADSRDIPIIATNRRQIVKRILNPKRLPKALHLVQYRVQISCNDLTPTGTTTLYLCRTGIPACLEQPEQNEQAPTEAKDSTIRMTGSWEDDAAPSVAGIGHEIHGLSDFSGPVTQQIPPGQDVGLYNDSLAVTIHPNGTFYILDGLTDRLWENLHIFEDSADRGNEYIFMPAAPHQTITSEKAQAKISVTRTNLLEMAEVKLDLEVPYEFDDLKATRSSTTTTISITTRITLRHGARSVEIETELVNTAKDHRLRVLYPTDLYGTACYADSPFDLVKRPYETGVEGRNNTHPMESLVAVSDDLHGLALFSAGMPEYEILPDRDTIAHTLLRCTDLLGDMPPVGYQKEQLVSDFTPDAQCLRPYTFRYALYPFTGVALDSGLETECDRYLHPPRAVQAPARPDEWLGYRPGAPRFFDYFEDQQSLIPVPARQDGLRSLLRFDNPNVTLIAAKPPEPGEGAPAADFRWDTASPVTLVIRLCNYSYWDPKTTVNTTYPLQSVSRLNLDESEIEPVAVHGNSFIADLAPWQIGTYRLTFQPKEFPPPKGDPLPTEF